MENNSQFGLEKIHRGLASERRTDKGIQDRGLILAGFKESHHLPGMSVERQKDYDGEALPPLLLAYHTIIRLSIKKCVANSG